MTFHKTLRTAEGLIEAGLVDAARLPDLQAVAARYAVAVTPAMAELIAGEGGSGPIGRQFLPDAAELRTEPVESADPIGDFAHSPLEGIVHRYPDRVLLKVTHTCAVYCRFCFRREMVGPDGHGALAGEALDAALAYIAARQEIWEVILTGGDPLVLSPRRIAELMARLGEIDHLKIVRIHTRVPAVDPAAVTPELVDALRPPAGKTVWVALHANHADELTPAARAACARLIDAGLPMVSQTVLLKGVNDTPEALAALMRAFVETRIRPYYLHHPDLAPGTSHLRPTLEAGRAVVSALRGAVSGLCQPTYVVDLPGGRGKVPAEDAWLKAGPAGEPDYASARPPTTNAHPGEDRDLD
jgi:lysine 2,3-aminomutase